MNNIYCVVVTYNGLRWIDKCLQSLRNSSCPLNVIVIDNASTDSTISFIQNRYPEVELIISDQNLGFGQANNKGIQIAIKHQADFIFLLNQDAWIEPHTVTQLINAHTGNTAYGILSPIHLNGKGSALDPYFVKYFVQSDIGAFIDSKLLNCDLEQRIVNTNFVNAAAWLISRECILATGGFDPIFFHYGEDLDYTHRVLYREFKIGIVTNAIIYHDREERISKNLETESAMNKDWIYFLAQACDIRREKYKSLMLRRFLRCLFLGVINFLMLNIRKAKYDFFMVKKIIGSMTAVANSRRISTGTMAHLHTEK